MKALAPEHLNDLRASGWSDETITAHQVEAVRPHDINLRNVKSAYRIPYWTLAREKNCFERWKLFPPIIDDTGRTQKYWQPPQTAPQVFWPPTVDWATAAADPGIPLVGTEGEKKAGALCQLRRPCFGIAGVWNWGQQLDNGERLTIPTLDQIVWTQRPLDLVPDSDVWRPDKQQALMGFYALGMDRQLRGARVCLVKLPEAGGRKVGLDDWLLSVGTAWETLWPMLERIPLDDERLAPLAARWQRWKERQATHEALKQHDVDELEVTETAGLYVVRSAKHAVRLTFDRLADQRGGVTAELTVTLGATNLLDGVDVGLKSDPAHTRLAKSLKSFAPSIPWKLLLQKACTLTLRRYRTGTPLVRLDAQTPIEPLTYAINPLTFKKKVTILFGDGGLGKSSLALFLAMLVSTGQQVAGLQALKGKSLFLDYEDDADVHGCRLRAIIAGHPDLGPAYVEYQRCTEPLTRLTPTLVRQIQAQGITFVVLDSIMAATGGDSSAEATTKLFAALRVLNTETLALGHVPKNLAEGQEHPTVYGSVFNQNFARSVWELKKQQEIGEDGAVLGLFHRKSNLSRLHHPIGLRVTQHRDGTLIRYESFDLAQAEELAAALPLASRIRNLLEDGNPRSAKDIAEQLDAKLGSVKTTLANHNGRKWHRVGEYHNGTWTVLNC